MVNLPGVPLPHFDPTCVVLAMVASVEAIFLSTFILITQNRIATQAQKRADLDLQISLLAEHEITRLLTLTVAMAERLGSRQSRIRSSPNSPRMSSQSRCWIPWRRCSTRLRPTPRHSETRLMRGRDDTNCPRLSAPLRSPSSHRPGERAAT